MNREIEVLTRYLNDMASIINAVPDEKFEIENEEKILILLRRMESCDLQKELTIFTTALCRDSFPTGEDLSAAAVAYVKIKTLCEAEKEDFDPITLRVLVKELNIQKDKVSNIIQLSKVNALTAEQYQKEVIQKTLDKSRLYLTAFDNEIKKIEEEIGNEICAMEEQKEDEMPKLENEQERKEKKTFIILELIRAAIKRIKDRIHKREIDNDLKQEETKLSSSRCGEIPFYGHSLRFDESFVCKDIPEFSVYIRKNNVYFGLTKNANASVYDNRDQSLFELMNVNSTVFQFLKVDLLSTKFRLLPFSKKAKEAMGLYFNLICVCFEKHLGKILTVQEYLRFKDYYNRLYLAMQKVEEEERKDYHYSLIVADSYLSYIRAYDIPVTKNLEAISLDLIDGRISEYLSDLQTIVENHIVRDEAKKKVLALMDSIRYFEETEEDVPVKEA